MISLPPAATFVRAEVSAFMALAKDVIKLLERKKPMVLCDRCIAEELHADPASVEQITSTLLLTSDFNGTLGSCPCCKEMRKLLRRAANVSPVAWLP